jgi:hypothetical protein
MNRSSSLTKKIMDNELNVTNTEDAIQLEARGEFTLRCGDKIKQELMLSAARAGAESLNLVEASAMDLAGIQLAYAWKKSLEQRGRKAVVILPEAENIKDLFTRTGITQIL